MSAANLTTTCPACGAEESLDAIIGRMIEDDQVRRLIADVLCASLPLGGLVVRYLRLFKPAKHRLTMAKVHKVLAELVPDITRGAVLRKGREWAAPLDTWKAALAAVFEAQERGTLTLPLEGNAYLYEVLLRMADKAEAEAERAREDQQRHRPHAERSSSDAGVHAAAAVAPAPPPLAQAAVAPPPRSTPFVRQRLQEIEDAKRRRGESATPENHDLVDETAGLAPSTTPAPQAHAERNPE